MSLERSAALSLDAGLESGRVVALATRKSIGRVTLSEQVPDRFVIRGSRMSVVSGDTLISAELVDARRSVLRAIRSTTYVEPFAPGAPSAPGRELSARPIAPKLLVLSGSSFT